MGPAYLIQHSISWIFHTCTSYIRYILIIQYSKTMFTLLFTIPNTILSTIYNRKQSNKQQGNKDMLIKKTDVRAQIKEQIRLVDTQSYTCHINVPSPYSFVILVEWTENISLYPNVVSAPFVPWDVYWIGFQPRKASLTYD